VEIGARLTDRTEAVIVDGKESRRLFYAIERGGVGG
jgi:hypothetical protein